MDLKKGNFTDMLHEPIDYSQQRCHMGLLRVSAQLRTAHRAEASPKAGAGGGAGGGAQALGPGVCTHEDKTLAGQRPPSSQLEQGQEWPWCQATRGKLTWWCGFCGLRNTC